MITIVASALLLAAPASTQDLAPAAELPPAGEVLQRYVEVTGGREAYARIENRVSIGTIELGVTQAPIKVKLYAAPGGRTYVRQEIAEGQVAEWGTTAEVAWERSGPGPATVHRGANRGALLRQAVFDRVAHWEKAWSKAECVGTREVDGQTCYELVMTPRPFDDAEKAEGGEPAPDRLFFSRDTGILVMGIRRAGNPAVDVEIHLGEYHRVDGVLLPFVTRQQVPGQGAVTLRIHTIQQNVLLMPGQLDLPADVRAIVDQGK